MSPLDRLRIQREIIEGFDVREYDEAETLDAHGWLANLDMRARLLTEQDGAEMRENVRRLFAHPIHWPRIARREHQSNGEAYVPLIDIGEANMASWVARHRARAAISIDLAAPADVLAKQFRQWVISARKQRGIPPINRQFSARDFERWNEKRVLPYLDFRIFERAFGGNFPLDWIGEKLFPDEPGVNLGSRVARTVRPLAEILIEPACLANLRSLCE